ncbi:alpha-N-acetylneuraminide alpha-2,8-sialyltransferase, partial [Dipodomys spectabilis]|uniref:alpha-N-acetylneuraminide alpha-2,8-sialyltransferase n=1 Tax=Dipodomys spectabilis TaxID=105255 RepID=UPI001C5368F5
MAARGWRLARTRLPVGASALCALLLCGLYVLPAGRAPRQQDIIRAVLRRRAAWAPNRTAARAFRKQMEECCDPAHLFAMTKLNSPMGTSMWYDGELLHSFTIDSSTYALFPQ